MEDNSHILHSILERFESLNAVPRKSKNESAIRSWLATWADSQGFTHKTDTTGNLVIYIPASDGRDSESPIILQGHMDMVCEKTPESSHDFSTDPIEHHIEGDWLKANDTTLGADNGIALALSMEASVSVSHPPLELLFTVDEETGLTGARNLDASLLKGRHLINLDSEDEGVFTIGCAGGRDAIVTLPLQNTDGSEDGGNDEKTGKDTSCIRIYVCGLDGGHSGVDVDKQGGNANRLLGRVLDELLRSDETKSAILGFTDIDGGSARNAIPRDAHIDLIITSDETPSIQRRVAEFLEIVRNELGTGDAGLDIQIKKLENPKNGEKRFPKDYLERVVSVLLALPTGVQRMSNNVPGLVETSSNLALCNVKNTGVEITVSVRSSLNSRIDDVGRRVEAIAKLATGSCRFENSYPAWPPEPDAKFLKTAVSVYESTFHEKPKVEAIHAGLECAVIGASIADIEMISIGPTIRGAHSPRERLNIPSLAKLWKYLKALLENPISET